MAAITLDRTGITLTNDTGTPASPVGDGTLLSAADRVAVLDKIDQLFNGTRSATFTLATLLAVENFGTHSFSAGGTGGNILRVRNTTAGTGNYSRIELGNDTGTTVGTLTVGSSTSTFGDPSTANGLGVASTGAGGLVIAATHASGTLRFMSGGLNTRLTIGTSGTITPDATALMHAGFLAYAAADVAGVANNADISFGTEVYDEGGHFASSTFTAPTTGRYMLSAHVSLTNSTAGAIAMQSVFRVSNHTFGFNFGYDSSVAAGATVGHSGSVVVDMDAADTATVRYYGGGNCTVEGDASQRFSWFCGRRVL